MTNSIIRVLIKVFLTLIICIIFSMLRPILPPIVTACLLIATVFGVWRYKPQQNNNDEPKLKK